MAELIQKNVSAGRGWRQEVELGSSGLCTAIDYQQRVKELERELAARNETAESLRSSAWRPKVERHAHFCAILRKQFSLLSPPALAG